MIVGRRCHKRKTRRVFSFLSREKSPGHQDARNSHVGRNHRPPARVHASVVHETILHVRVCAMLKVAKSTFHKKTRTTNQGRVVAGSTARQCTLWFRGTARIACGTMPRRNFLINKGESTISCRLALNCDQGGRESEKVESPQTTQLLRQRGDTTQRDLDATRQNNQPARILPPTDPTHRADVFVVTLTIKMVTLSKVYTYKSVSVNTHGTMGGLNCARKHNNKPTSTHLEHPHKHKCLLHQRNGRKHHRSQNSVCVCRTKQHSMVQRNNRPCCAFQPNRRRRIPTKKCRAASTALFEFICHASQA